jgi:hypothetical protein
VDWYRDNGSCYPKFWSKLAQDQAGREKCKPTTIAPVSPGGLGKPGLGSHLSGPEPPSDIYSPAG